MPCVRSVIPRGITDQAVEAVKEFRPRIENGRVKSTDVAAIDGANGARSERRTNDNDHLKRPKRPPAHVHALEAPLRAELTREKVQRTWGGDTLCDDRPFFYCFT